MTTEAEKVHYDLKFLPTEESISLAADRLKRACQLPPNATVVWVRSEVRIGRFGPWGHEQFRETNAEKIFEKEEIKRLIAKAKYSLWLELQDAGKQQEADKILNRKVGEVTPLQLNKLRELDCEFKLHQD